MVGRLTIRSLLNASCQTAKLLPWIKIKDKLKDVLERN